MVVWLRPCESRSSSALYSSLPPTLIRWGFCLRGGLDDCLILCLKVPLLNSTLQKVISQTELSSSENSDSCAPIKQFLRWQSYKVGSNYQEAMQYPSLNVRGMASAAIGDKVATIVPDMAVAELDLRTTPESDANYPTLPSSSKLIFKNKVIIW